MSDINGGALDLLRALQETAGPRADQLDAEAAVLEAKAMMLRVEAFKYRALDRTMQRMRDEP